MKLRYSFALLPVVGAAFLTSCAVYVPTVPSTPLVTKAGDVEVTAAVRGLSSLEVGGAWSPAAHVVVTGETALMVSNGSETVNGSTWKYTSVHKQAGVGVGTYRLVGAEQKGYLGAIGGFGLAKANVYDPHADDLIIPIFGKRPTTYFEATYQRYYGQLYAAHLGEVVSYGASARGTFVHYSQLQRNYEAIASPTNFFIEPTLFLRAGRGPLQFQGTLGFSIPTHVDAGSESQRNLSPVSMLISAGVVLRPQLFRHRADD
ncbi:hypothetical protein [Hymenobacter ruber]